MKKLIFLLIAELLGTVSLFPGEWLLEPGDSSVFLPEGWLINDNSEEDRISFISPEEDVIFQVTSYPGSTYDSDLTMLDDHMADLDITEQDLSRFYYQGRPCSMADLQIISGGDQIRGWFVFLDREDRDYCLTAITGASSYEKKLPLILSCLDGFSPDEAGRMQPGVISVLSSTFDDREMVKKLVFNGKEIPFHWNSGKDESLRLLIEREASILSGYQDPQKFDDAWSRYYQMIYRASFGAMEELAIDLDRATAGLTDTEKAERILSWLQNFQFGSTNLFSDLLTPIESVSTETGDCDALALVYILLLRHMNIPSVLMVSRVYSHAMAAAAVEKEGAHFNLGQTEFVVAELTKKVNLGQISADMADLDNWVIIPFEDFINGSLTIGSSK